jgi:antitoxin YefM
VVISEDEYESMAETLHLLGNPINAMRLRESIAQAEAGQVTMMEPIQITP